MCNCVVVSMLVILLALLYYIVLVSVELKNASLSRTFVHLRLKWLSWLCCWSVETNGWSVFVKAWDVRKVFDFLCSFLWSSEYFEMAGIFIVPSFDMFILLLLLWPMHIKTDLRDVGSVANVSAILRSYLFWRSNPLYLISCPKRTHTRVAVVVWSSMILIHES